jgi:DNA segregation ATPase FtsK/SpoIIIE, S-DNA-T family
MKESRGGNSAKNQPKNSAPEEAPLKRRGFTYPRFGKLRDFFGNAQVQRTIGLLLLFTAAILLLSFVSFLLNWFSEGSDDVFSGLSIGRIVLDQSMETGNWVGRLGARLANLFLKEWFGLPSFLFILLALNSGLALFIRHNLLPQGKTLRHSLFLILFASILFGYVFRFGRMGIMGGSVGFEVAEYLRGLIGHAGTGVSMAFVFLLYLVVSFNFSLPTIRRRSTPETVEAVNAAAFDSTLPIPDPEPLGTEATAEAMEGMELRTAEIDPDLISGVMPIDMEEEYPPVEGQEVEFTIEERVEEEHAPIIEHYTIDTPYDPTLDLRDFRLPTLDLLHDRGDGEVQVQRDELEANKNRIISTLNNYSIQIDKIKATIGPTVTLYEIVPAAGVRISKIKNLEDDIALSLSALGIRIIAPMPGKGTIGIEVPNKTPEIVGMRSILASDRFRQTKYELPIGLGKTVSNESFVADLAKMPHLLMAGATGQGKSVGLNAIITSLLYKKHPSQLKFVLVDPKKVELTLFSKIERHYLAKLPDLEEAIITDTRDVVRTLNSLCIEMDHRYNLLKYAQVRNITEYNERFIARKLNPNDGHAFLPYIVLIIDEFADLIMTAGKELEAPIARLAQLSRAVGIHLIIATQRPSVNIITGTIKANFPARLAFRVTSKIDSRTILDSSGADQLIGRGDMLLMTGSDLIRLQCAFVDIDEVERITDFIGSQRAYPAPFALPEYNDEESLQGKDLEPGEKDELFDEAARVIVQHQHGSTSLLQRKLKLGYNRAGRLIDQLEAAGVVGRFEGSKAREVLISDLETLERFLREKN